MQDFNAAIQLHASYHSFLSRCEAYIELGDYDRALQDINRSLELKPRNAEALSLRSLVFTQKGEYADAIQDLDQAALLEPDPKLVATHGQLNFYLGRFADAHADFSRAAELKPDIYIALWLYVTQSRNGQDGRTDLERNIAQLDRTIWPGPIAELYLGHLTPIQILAAANSDDKQKNREQHCEAYFYIGEQELLSGNANKAQELFKKSIHTGMKMFVEYTAAQTELERLRHR